MATQGSAFVDWRKQILKSLQDRNDTQCKQFEDIIVFSTQLFERVDSLRANNVQLTVQKERLQQENLQLQMNTESSLGKPRAALETKIYQLQEEMTELLRHKSEHSQQLIDAKNSLEEKERQLHQKDTRIQECEAELGTLKQTLNTTSKELQDMKDANQLLRDEHEALQLAYNSLERNFSTLERDHQDLIKRWMALKSRDADKLNAENERMLRLKQAQVKRDLEDAAREPVVVPNDKVTPGQPSRTSAVWGLRRWSLGGEARSTHAGPAAGSRQARHDLVRTAPHLPTGATDMPLRSKQVRKMKRTRSVPPLCLQSFVPNRLLLKFEAHDGEVNAVQFSPSGRILCTGGGDRKVKIWEFTRDQALLRGTLGGSNATVMSLDMDTEENLVLAASNDFSSRVWTLGDQRLRHTLTGHSRKVLAAKFLGDTGRVASGSHDRTLKIWDLRSRACIRTIFAGSSCNDLVASDSAGTTIISGHFDKRLRFWDSRAESSANEIVLGGLISSLDLSADRCQLLCCVRDDTLKLLDVRMNQVLVSFQDDSFKVACDWTRAKFSPDASYVAVGSHDGTLFIWNTQTAKLEKKLKEMSSPIIACSWNPSGDYIASSDRDKRICVWSQV
ncbi:autophagy-related protein 16-1 isoform X1 [Dermacentor andersoni]|uniref:autophagy-related protein 16-1 isoform X1 n=1 Tax=Dermacentor andersoni TaxID=34620 RepID=UPI002155A6B3|nr:autophagy-related protein 16-1-like isoform X1 [Dermacentor andersoni]